MNRSWFRAWGNEVAQRVITGNKHQQRRFIADRVRQLTLADSAQVLDFGCGTGLFAPTLARLGLRYVGYDVDAGFVEYARRRRPQFTWLTSLADARQRAPFDLILANCCFHHIADDEIQDAVVPAITGMMHPRSVFLLIDILPPERGASMVRRLHGGVEQGDHRRELRDLDRLVAPFEVQRRDTARWHTLPLATRMDPLVVDVAVFELRLRSGGDRAQV
jgi:SAM-dependent methyltransferase